MDVKSSKSLGPTGRERGSIAEYNDYLALNDNFHRNNDILSSAQQDVNDAQLSLNSALRYRGVGTARQQAQTEVYIQRAEKALNDAKSALETAEEANRKYRNSREYQTYKQLINSGYKQNYGRYYERNQEEVDRRRNRRSNR